MSQHPRGSWSWTNTPLVQGRSSMDQSRFWLWSIWSMVFSFQKRKKIKKERERKRERAGDGDPKILDHMDQNQKRLDHAGSPLDQRGVGLGPIQDRSRTGPGLVQNRGLLWQAPRRGKPAAEAPGAPGRP